MTVCSAEDGASTGGHRQRRAMRLVFLSSENSNRTQQNVGLTPHNRHFRHVPTGLPERCRHLWASRLFTSKQTLDIPKPRAKRKFRCQLGILLLSITG